MADATPEERSATAGASSPEAFTVLDRIGTNIACLSAALLLLFPFVGRTFGAMFRDFGTTQLPWLTRLAVTWWFPLLLALAPAGALGQVFRTSAPVQRRRAWAVRAFVLALFGLAVCLVGVYLPIFDLAGKIKADEPW